MIYRTKQNVSSMGERPLRLAFLDTSYHSIYGAQRSLLTLLANLDRARVQPVLVTPAEGILADTFRNADVPVEVVKGVRGMEVFGRAGLDGSNRARVEFATSMLRFNLSLRRWLKSRKIDLLYVNSLRAFLFGGIAARTLGIPLLLYLRGDPPFPRLNALALRTSSRVICISQATHESFTPKDRERYQHRISTLYTGFNVPGFEQDCEGRARVRREIGVAEEEPVIGLVGSICPRKGHDILVESADTVLRSFPKAKFLIAGSAARGHERFEEDLRAAVIARDIEKHVHWAGFSEDIQSLYAAMDVLVLPSRSEGLPRAVVEGLASGLPVVATDVGGTREILTSPEHGQLIAPNDARELAAAITAMLDQGIDRLGAEAMRRRRAGYVREKFGIGSYVEGFMDIVDDVASAARCNGNS